MSCDNDPVTVVFADDYIILRGLIRALLLTDSRLCLVGEAATGTTLIHLCATVRPALVLMDFHMPGPGAPAVVSRIRESSPHSRIIVVSNEDSCLQVQSVLQLGIDGYVLKDDLAERLLEAIQSVYQGTAWYSPALRPLVDA